MFGFYLLDHVLTFVMILAHIYSFLLYIRSANILYIPIYLAYNIKYVHVPYISIQINQQFSKFNFK